MNTRNLYAIIALILGIPLAIFLGLSVVQDQVGTVLWIVGIGFFLLCVGLGKHIWILIPATLGMKGTISCLPGSPAPWYLMTAIVLGFTVLRIAIRRQKIEFRWTGMETAILLVAFTILQAFIRNPTGLSMLGGEYAGGKPYFVFGVAMIAFLLVGTADADMKSWCFGVGAYIIFSLFDGILASLSVLSPQFSMILIRYYSNVNLDAVMTVNYYVDISEMRLSELGQVGSVLGLIATTFWRPVAALDFRKPWRALIAGFAVLLILLSGFRSAIVRLGVNFIYGSVLRRKPIDVLAVFMVGLLFLVGIVGAGLTKKLPYGAQRALSFLPIEVRSDVRHAAEGSKDLRIDMWKQVLSTDRYISNKILGDGFQISSSEQAARDAWTSGDARMRQSMTKEQMHLESGSYHGFHVETIRFTGVVGLIAATAVLIVFAVFASRCIKYFRGNRHWGFVLFVCMPFLIHPWWYWAVFGSYKAYFPILIAWAGMVKLLSMLRQRQIADEARAVDLEDGETSSVAPNQ